MSTATPKGNALALGLATMGFLVTFYAWSMLGPLGPDLKEALGLSGVQLAMVVAVPVLMGSLMRIPLGILTDRIGGRRVFSGLLAFTLVPLALLAVWHSSFSALIILGFFLGFAGASFAVGVPFVSRWYPKERQGRALGIYGMGMGGTVLGGLTAPRIADRVGANAVLRVVFGAVAILAVALSFGYESMAVLTIAVLVLGGVLGLGTGAVFKLVAQDFPDEVGAVTGVVGAAGGLGGFFPPIVMATTYGLTGSYVMAFLLLGLTSIGCLVVLLLMTRRPGDGASASGVMAT